MLFRVHKKNRTIAIIQIKKSEIYTDLRDDSLSRCLMWAMAFSPTMVGRKWYRKSFRVKQGIYISDSFQGATRESGLSIALLGWVVRHQQEASKWSIAVVKSGNYWAGGSPWRIHRKKGFNCQCLECSTITKACTLLRALDRSFLMRNSRQLDTRSWS